MRGAVQIASRRMPDTMTVPLRSMAPPPALPALTRIVCGSPEIRRAAEQLVAESRREQLVSLPGSATGERITRLHAVVDRPLERGVTVRRLTSLATLTGSELGYLRDAARRGLHTRVLREVSAPFVVVDRRLVLVLLSQHAGTDRAAVIGDAVTVTMFAELFERHWEAAAALPAAPGPPAAALSTRQREIGELLSCGHTDESVARRLGVSVRTVRAEVAALRDALGAVSRFQAGVRYASMPD
jgi:DNA-binding NarL/FixJ family response regulator